MNKMLMLILSAVLFLPIFTSAADKQADRLKFKYDIFCEEVRKESEDLRVALFTQYAAAVERMGVAFQQSGDLDNVIKTKNEVALARDKQETGKAEFPGAEKIRETLKASLAGINEKETIGIQKLTVDFLASLQPLQRELTKSGKIDEAIAVKKLIESLAVEKVAQIGSQGTTSGEKLSLVDKSFSISVLNSGSNVVGVHSLEPGRYRGFGQISLGDYAIKDKSKNRGEIHIPQGCEVSDGTIFGNIGIIDLSRSYFHDMEFWQNLHCDFSAEGSLFDNCIFKKAGGWGARVSSRWKFDNCVINKSFFPVWKKRLVGIQARNCTFEGVKFASYPYFEDAGIEAVDDWFVFERCLFRNCSIPESLLIATSDCLFENCKFVRDDIKIETRMRVTLYHRGDTFGLPKDRDKIKYEHRPEAKLTKRKVGSGMAYSLSGKTLKPVE